MAPKTDKNRRKKPNSQRKKATKSDSKSINERPKSVSLLLSATVALLTFIGTILVPPVKHWIVEWMIKRPVVSNNDTSTISHHHVPCTPTNLNNYIHSTPINGLHILCIEAVKLDIEGNELPSSGVYHPRRLDESNSLRLIFYQNSHPHRLQRRLIVNGTYEKGNNVQGLKWTSLRAEIIKELGLRPHERKKQPWAIFSALGDRIVGETDPIEKTGQEVIEQLLSSEMVMLVEGGSWIWPGVAEGFRRTVDVTSGKSQVRTVSIETLSLKPLVVSIEGFLDNDECDYIVKKAAPRVRYSEVSLMDDHEGEASQWRTSQSAFLKSTNDDVLAEIDDRVASLTRIPKSHGESVQVLRYATGEKYDAHHDYFDVNLYRNDPGTLQLIDGGKRNRFATVFWYLTDANDGGETIFPRYGGAPTPHDLSNCKVGLKVKPQKGKVIIFYSLDAAGDLDNYSLHGACPVGEGNLKWAANKWIWNAPMQFIQ